MTQNQNSGRRERSRSYDLEAQQYRGRNSDVRKGLISNREEARFRSDLYRDYNPNIERLQILEERRRRIHKKKKAPGCCARTNRKICSRIGIYFFYCLLLAIGLLIGGGFLAKFRLEECQSKVDILKTENESFKEKLKQSRPKSSLEDFESMAQARSLE